MESIAFARAGLLGNPSDGYNGKTISFIVKDFFAQVNFSQSNKVVFHSGLNDGLTFDSVEEFADTLNGLGIYGGIRLLKSATLRFVNYCRAKGLGQFKPFEVSVQSNIPRQVGMAGSSAIVVAMLKGLCQWNDFPIAPDVLASLALAAENDLGIAAGLQDRVIQSFEGMVYMDFDKGSMKNIDGFDIGVYEQINSSNICNLFLAYANDLAESTEVLHSDLRKRFESAEKTVIDTLEKISTLAIKGKICIESGNWNELSDLVNQNFDLRKSICKLHPGHVQMIETAREAGASAKYCGSGGAIVGIYPDEQTYQNLVEAMNSINCVTFKPQIA